MAKLALFAALLVLAIAGCQAAGGLMDKASVDAMSQVIGAKMTEVLTKAVATMGEIGKAMAEAAKDGNVQKVIGEGTKAFAEMQIILTGMAKQFM